jgi:hypothetical protein
MMRRIFIRVSLKESCLDESLPHQKKTIREEITDGEKTDKPDTKISKFFKNKSLQNFNIKSKKKIPYAAAPAFGVGPC